jgi:hypothetical protein
MQDELPPTSPQGTQGNHLRIGYTSDNLNDTLKRKTLTNTGDYVPLETIQRRNGNDQGFRQSEDVS